jgi:hypothetical protein
MIHSPEEVSSGGFFTQYKGVPPGLNTECHTHYATRKYGPRGNTQPEQALLHEEAFMTENTHLIPRIQGVSVK